MPLFQGIFTHFLPLFQGIYACFLPLFQDFRIIGRDFARVGDRGGGGIVIFSEGLGSFYLQ